MYGMCTYNTKLGKFRAHITVHIGKYSSTMAHLVVGVEWIIRFNQMDALGVPPFQETLICQK